jgi:hypothetical protein
LIARQRLGRRLQHREATLASVTTNRDLRHANVSPRPRRKAYHDSFIRKETRFNGAAKDTKHYVLAEGPARSLCVD